MVFRNNYRLPRMQLNKVSKPGIKLIRYSFAHRQQMRYLIPGASVIVIRNEYLTLYAQRSFEAAGRFKVKYYTLITRGKAVVPFKVPKAETALMLLFKGELLINIADLKNIVLDETAPCSIVLPAGVHKQVFTAGEYHILHISIKEEFLKTHALVHPFMSAMHASKYCNKAHFTAIPFSEKIQQLVSELKNVLTHETTDVALNKCLFDAHVMQLVIHAFRAISHPRQRVSKVITDADRMDKIQQVKTYIDKYYTQPVTLVSIANACHIPYDQMERCFKLLDGKNPGEYLMELRVKRAAGLLKLTDYPLAKIAQETGFKNSGYLGTAFEKTYNCLPLVYRAKEKDK